MLSMQDYLGYLNQMREVEKEMKDFYIKETQRLDAPRFKEVMESLSNDEARHETIVSSLIKFIEDRYPERE